MPSIYNKDKPWDTEDIDKWKIDPFKPGDNAAGHFVEESSFATLFPKVGSDPRHVALCVAHDLLTLVYNSTEKSTFARHGRS